MVNNGFLISNWCQIVTYYFPSSKMHKVSVHDICCAFSEELASKEKVVYLKD